ncbi:MAG: hypothetical protein JXB05_28405 [Myxococcaceae bacterium]|nr:hypothetical protein [Myxococcaceae bacterium]
MNSAGEVHALNGASSSSSLAAGEGHPAGTVEPVALKVLEAGAEGPAAERSAIVR